VMATYPDDRADDVVGRVAFIETMIFDLDRLAHACESLAHKNRGHPELFGFLRRISTACRDGHDQLEIIIASAPATVRAAIKRSLT
jgi:hypothetical protein